MQRVRWGDIQDRRQLLQLLGRVPAWGHRLDSVGYRQRDGTQFVADILLQDRE